MNQGYGDNMYGQHGNTGSHIPFNSMLQQRQPPPWNLQMNRNMPPGRFPPNNFHGRGSFSGGPAYHQTQQYPLFQPRGNCNQSRFNRPHGNFDNKQFQHGKGKKKRIDKRDLPENNKYFCDTCDRGFCSEQKFEEHVNSHEKCSDPTCSYIAAPKLVQLHYQMQHRTGLARKIWQQDSPEDIKKWIEERKRNFPTAQNIERKKLLSAEKDERGEKLETKYFGKMRGGRNQSRRGRQRNRKRHFEDNELYNDEPSGAKKSNTETQKIPEYKMPPSSSLALNNSDPLSVILQQPQSGDKGEGKMQSDMNVAGGLASIMASYAADSESDESLQPSPIKNKSPEKSHTVVTQDMKEWGPRGTKHMTNKQKRNQKKNAVSEVLRTKQPTLLERLLAKEIRHERNVLLQCVHYIVKKNFFGIDMEGKKSCVGS